MRPPRWEAKGQLTHPLPQGLCAFNSQGSRDPSARGGAQVKSICGGSKFLRHPRVPPTNPPNPPFQNPSLWSQVNHQTQNPGPKGGTENQTRKQAKPKRVKVQTSQTCFFELLGRVCQSVRLTKDPFDHHII